MTKRGRMAKAPLRGIQVISFGFGASEPDASRLLAEMGADIIKVESKENLDFMRTIMGDVNTSPGFNESNRNKRSFGVNLKTEEGRQLVRQLITNMDVLCENLRGGAMDKLGLGYRSVREIKPDIVYLNCGGFGKGNPLDQYQAYGPVLHGLSGAMSLWKHPNDPYPIGSNAPIPDHLAAKQAAFAVITALDYRRRTGRGQLISMSQLEVAAALAGESYLEYTINHRVPKAVGNRHPFAAPHGCYRCRGDDEWCAISVFTEDEWARFRRALGNPPWTTDARFSGVLRRIQNVDELDRLVTEWTEERTPYEVMNSLQAAGVAAGALQRAQDWLEDPQIKHLQAVVEVEHPVAGRRLYPRPPVRMSGAALPLSAPAPLLGQHTVEISRDLLGLSDEAIRHLTEAKVLETG